VTDPAGYRGDNQSAWAAVQLLATERLEIFANTMWNAGDGAITGVNFDPSTLPVPGNPTGLDFGLMNQSMSAFSALKVRHLIQTAGVNYRLTDKVLFNSQVGYNDYKDSTAYLFDATGRYLTFHAGLSWVF
jgi:hypothetical protein